MSESTRDTITQTNGSKFLEDELNEFDAAINVMASNRDHNAITQLIADNIDISTIYRSKSGMSLLHWATWLGDEQLVSLLVDIGMDPHERWDGGLFKSESPYEIATKYGRHKALEALKQSALSDRQK